MAKSKLKGNGNGKFGVAAIAARILLSLFLVFATYNPSGRSYYHWLLESGLDVPRLAVGLILLGTYIALVFATWEVIGFSGIFLVGAICLSVAWWLDELGAIELASDVTFLLVMSITFSIIIAWGMSFSFLFARITGIVHTRTALHN